MSQRSIGDSSYLLIFKDLEDLVVEYSLALRFHDGTPVTYIGIWLHLEDVLNNSVALRIPKIDLIVVFCNDGILQASEYLDHFLL